MLHSEPPLSYARISATLSMPVGSIGPQRARCLERLRRSSYLTAFSDCAVMGGPAEVMRTSDAGGGHRA